jgi:hypothetical protein
MSFNISDSSKFAKDKSVICDYYDSSIYFNQYERTPNNGGCIKIPYFTPENVVKPNGLFISSEPTVKYMSSSLHIYKKTHDIGGIDYDGELVIENKKITNGDSKLFVCFPLKTSNVNANKIDEIISKSEKSNSNELKTTVNLNSMFNKLQKYIFYKSGNDIVVVFTEPIKVYSMFDKKYVECNLFSKYNDTYSILQNIAGKEGFTEGFVEGLRSGEMDCTPIDITTNKPLVNDTMIVGLNSGTASQNKTINLLFAMIMFVIIFSISFFAGPPAYKYIFANEQLFNDAKLTYTITFCILYLGWVIGMIVGGMMYDVRTAISGIIFMFLLGMSGLSVFGRILFDKTYFPDVTIDYDINQLYTSLKTFVPLYVGDIKPFLTFKGSKYKYGYISGIFSVIVTVILFAVIATTSKKSKSKTNSGKSKKDKNLKGYLDFAYSMLGIFGFGYGIFVVAPFIGYITSSS